MTTVRSRQPASMRTLHQALAAPSRPVEETDGFGEWESGDMSWAWRQLNRPALPAPAPAETRTAPAETKTENRPVVEFRPAAVVESKQVSAGNDWPSIQSSIAATAPAAATPISLAPIRAAVAASRPAIRPASARASSADAAPIAPILFEETPPPASTASETSIDGMKWPAGAAMAASRRPAAVRRSKVLGISAVAVLVASGVAYSALQIFSGPGSTTIAAAAAPFGSTAAPPGQTTLIQAPVGPIAPALAASAPTPAVPGIDAGTTAAIPRSTERLPEPGTTPAASAFPPVQTVTTTAVVPTPPADSIPPVPEGADPLGDAILIAEKDRVADGVPAPTAAPTPVTAPTVVAALPTPRTPAPATAAAAPVSARQPAPTVAAVAPAAAPTGPRIQATARDYVNMRSGPSNGSSVVSVVAAGSAVDVIRCNYWCQVQVGNQTGWIYQDFLDGPIDRRTRGRVVAAPAPTTTAAVQP